MDPLTTNSSCWLLRVLCLFWNQDQSPKRCHLHFMRRKSNLFSGGPWLEPLLLGPKAFGSGDNASHGVGTFKERQPVTV